MVTKTIHLVRHGQYYQRKEANTDSNSPTVGPEADARLLNQDLGLTPLGKEQAKLISTRLRKLTVHELHASSMPRALETAKIIGEALPTVPFAESRDLWEGIPHIPARLAEPAQSISADLVASDKAHADSVFKKHFQPIGDASDAEADRCIVVVCHGNIIRYLICCALQVTPEAWINFETSNCSISTVTIESDGACKLVSLNDASHLPPQLVSYSSVIVDDVESLPHEPLARSAPEYHESILETHRHIYCPKCTTPLIQKVLFDDEIPRTACPSCGWIQLIGNAVGVAVVAHRDGQIAVIEPPGEDGIGLPAGLVEYGEDPKEAAVREVLEETGLEVEIVGELGWFFDKSQGWPGPNIKFMYEAIIIGGELNGSEEGAAKLVDADNLPPVACGRTGSQRALVAFFAKG